MYIHYERSRVTGQKKQEGGGIREIVEDVTCRTTQDPMLLAMRRNHRMTECETVTVQTLEQFTRYIDEEPYRSRTDIPSMGGQPEFDW